MDAWLQSTAPDGTRFLLGDARSCRIGRSPDCNILLESRSVSRLHALIERMEGGEYCLIDLGSRNGSYINRARVTIPQTLRDTDRLSFGELELEFRCQGAAGSADRSTVSNTGHTTAVLQRVMTVTVLVIDLRDFTRFARSVEETRLSQTIGTWFKSVGGIVQRHGSYAQRYSGDSVMSVWLHERTADVAAEIKRILGAVLEVRAVTDGLQSSFSLPQPMRMGAGINTGQAVVGNSDYTVLGDSVNAAFRLEAATRMLGCDLALGQSSFAAAGFKPETAACFTRREVLLRGYDSVAAAWVADFDQLHRYLSGARTLAC